MRLGSLNGTGAGLRVKRSIGGFLGRVRLAGLGLLAAFTAARGATVNFQASWTNAYGQKTADYRIYCPPASDVPRIRGVIFLYPGSGGDWRFRADDTAFREAARSLGCALVGAGSNAGFTSITEAEARASVEAILAAAATASGHPEIVNAPLLFTGFSLGGFVSTEMANDVRERVVACAPQRGYSAFNSSMPAATRQVPVLFMPGSLDTNPLTSPSVADSVFDVWRSEGGLSAYAMDWLAGHDTFVNQGWSLAWVWMAECLALRLPSGTVPSLEPGNPVVLQDIPLASGWLGSRPYTTSAIGLDYSVHVDIAPYASYKGTVGSASWLPNEAVARAYQAQTSYDGVTTRGEIPLQGPVAIVGAAKPSSTIQPGQTNPPQLAVLPVGEPFDIEVDPRGFGREEVTLASQNLLANGDFSQWSSGLPTGWTCGNTAMISQGPDLSDAGGSAVIRDKASLSQTFTPVATNFQLRFTFTVNLTPGSNTWNQPLLINLYQANQATNASSPWLTFRFTAGDVAAGPFTASAFTNNSSTVQLSSTPVTGSTYDVGAGAFTGGPFAYEFVLNYTASNDSYSLSYGPAGGTLFSTGALRLFRNPTNPAFGGLQSLQFYAYVNGAALDGARLSVIESQTQPITSVTYYDGAELLGVQTEPGPEGWKLSHTLDTRGIHGLTVVAEDPFGTRSSAYRTVVAAEAVPSGVTHYRFERSPGFKADQYELLNLTSNATSGAGPQQVALGAAAAGSAFPRRFDFGDGTNAHAASFSAAKGDVFTCADSPLLPSDTTPFTVEAFVNLTTSGAGGTFRTIAAHGTGSTGSTLSWQLVVTGEGSGQGPRRLVLQFCGSASGALDTINSGFELQTNVDYYVAASFTPTNTSASGITFYFKDLTAGGALQSSNRTHTQTSITNATSSFAVGNRYDRGTGWDGVIDEFRLTTRALTAGELLVSAVPAPVVPGWVAPDDTRIAYSDYVRKSLVAAPFDAAVTLARFDRLLPITGKGYEWDNPGARVRFRTDATNVLASLYYNELHVSASARNSRGLYRVDGQTNALWAFQTVSTTTVRTQELITVSMAVPPGGGYHDYELVLPYGDSVDFHGLQVNPDALFEAPSDRSATRYLAYGDSITHGFTASDIGGGYAFRVAEAKGWQLVNMGYGGRASTIADGTVVGAQGADVITVLIGVNDWQGGVALATYSNRLDGFLANLRALQPTVPVYLLTPLWVDASWDPAADIAPLESYRQIVRDVAAARSDLNLHVVEGPELIDPSVVYFDAVRVHPNDAGFAQMSARLAAQMAATQQGAALKSWLGGSAASWSDASAWTPAGVPLASEPVSVSNSATATLTVPGGTAAAAASLAFDNASGKNATLAIADGARLTVGGAVTDGGAGSATVTVANATPTNAATALTAASLAASTLALTSAAAADQYLTTGFDLALAVQLQLGVGAVNQNIIYRQTNGTVSIANSDYGLCLLEGYVAPTSGVQTYVLAGGTLKADRIGVANGNGNNGGAINVERYAGNGELAFESGTLATRLDNGSVWIENGSAFETYNGTTVKAKDMQRNTSKPVSILLAQSGTHTFRADGSGGRIVVSPSARLTDKAGEAGTLVKAGQGALVLTGGGRSATNDWSGDTVVSQGVVRVDYSLLGGAPGSLDLRDAYSPRSRLVLAGGGFELVGRGSATNGAFSGVTVTSGGGFAESYTFAVPATNGLVVGQTVANPFLPAGTYIRRLLSGTSIALSHMSTSTVAQAGQRLDFGAATFGSVQTVSNVEFAAASSTVGVTPAGTDTRLTFVNTSGAGGLLKTGAGTLRLAGTVGHAGSNVVSAGTLDLASPVANLLTNAVAGSGVFRHTGPGTTVIDAAAANLNSFAGAVVVDGGTLQHGTANNNQRRGLSSAASYTVNAGGTMVTTRDAMRDGVPVSLNGGTLAMLKGFQCLGPLTLNGGALVTGPGQGGPYQAFALGADVAVTGGVPSVIRAEPGLYNGVHLTYNLLTAGRNTFRVDDVTGSAEADLTVTATLLDSSHTTTNAGLVKTGAGTLVLAGGAHTYHGATVVSNGTLLVGSGGVSNSAVTVVSGAAFGTADAATASVAALSLEEGASVVWRYDGASGTAGRIAVAGTLTLPASGTLAVVGAGFLRSGHVVLSAGALAGATDLAGWSVSGAPAGARLAIVGNEVRLPVCRGTRLLMK
ncbi:MAG TPA: GDSL-type esterase/lipase family protein [Kiritimatiellia bacterium]|nr:GDSL-type esterase/lipase family protein [Kiritimatiellia bacterium]HPS06913.1 GDSL-type esterase/lipase family protein [Kiritimatiellia bacterium]